VIEDPKAVTAYDETIIEGKLKPFIEITNSFGSDALKEQVGQQPDPLSAVNDG
jgi:adenylyl cyclase-associated protein